MTIRILTGDCRDVLPTLDAGSVHCVVTSPPYYGLRDYGTADAPLFADLPPVPSEDAYDRDMRDLFEEAAD